jgi:P-type Cu+ transporter
MSTSIEHQNGHSCCSEKADASSAPPARPYPLDVCLVSGAKLGSHGEPHVFIHEGQEVKLCCEGCLPAFQKEPEKYLAKLVPDARHSCCGGHSAEDTQNAAAERRPASAYFCPMCPGVESGAPGTCAKCGMALERNPLFRAPKRTLYTCPMHPEVQQDHPGACPNCGMALEPITVTAGEEEGGELRDMTRRFWIGAALTLPVFVVAMAHLLPGAPVWADGDPSRWVQFALSTPVVLWAGWPFFVRGWQSLVHRSLNMFTLVAMGVGVAWLYSAVVMLAPGAFPHSFQHHGKIGVYFEAAAVITVLVLLGQVLELRARARTISRLRARGSCAMARSATCRWKKCGAVTVCASVPARRSPSTAA